MEVAGNAFVQYLNRYTTASPDHEAAFDEFIAQLPPPTGKPLRFETRIEQFVRSRFGKPSPPSIILTGNAGDGKTYLCRQIVEALSDSVVSDWNHLVDKPIEARGHRFHVFKDLSELSDQRGTEVLTALTATLTSSLTDRYIIAANEGRLRDLLSKAELHELYELVDQQLREGPDLANEQLIIINLTAVTTSSFVESVLHWMTKAEHWQACETCSLITHCPIRFNAERLSDYHVSARVRLLYELLEHLGVHVTIRDMLIQLAYTITGNQNCADLSRQAEVRRDLSYLAYYENIWGRRDDQSYREKAGVAQQLGRLHVGEHSLFEIDDFIVNGQSKAPELQHEYEILFAPAVDLNGRRFAIDRDTYLRGGSTSGETSQDAALLAWLPHCRRKLFFEWPNIAQVNRLIPFLFLARYLELLNGERSTLERARRELVLGLNRAFSRLYLVDDEHLYVTTQYLAAAEQPRPLVRLRFPIDLIWLEVADLRSEAFDRDRYELQLVITPPPQLRAASTSFSPIRWSIGLMQFEYLMRLAGGGTYNILADECELGIRRLKDELLGTYASHIQDEGRVEFFVAARQRYELRQLWIDANNTIRG